MTLANLIYFEKAQLPQAVLANRLIRLWPPSRTQSSTRLRPCGSRCGKPRVVGNAENYPQHIALPRAVASMLPWICCGTTVSPVICGMSASAATPSMSPCRHFAFGPGSRSCRNAAPRHRRALRSDSLRQTVTAAAMIARRGVNTLVLVHRTELLKQWQERLQTFLGVGQGVVGTIGGGKAKPTGKIDIAVIQSLSRQNRSTHWSKTTGGDCGQVSSCRRSVIRRDPETVQGQIRAGTDGNAHPP